MAGYRDNLNVLTQNLEMEQAKYDKSLNEINQLDKNDPTRKAFSNITVTGRFVPGYKDKDGNIQNSASIEVAEFEFIQRLPNNNANAGNIII